MTHPRSSFAAPPQGGAASGPAKPDPRPPLGESLAVASPPGPLRSFWIHFSANAGAVAGLAIVVGVLLLAALAPWLAPYPPDLTNNTAFLRPPSWQEGGSSAYLLGTDAIGRDLLSRLMHGARLSLVIGIAVVALSIAVGIALGLIAGFARGVTDIVIMRMMDIILTLPSLLLAIVIVAILGPGVMNALLADSAATNAAALDESLSGQAVEL